MSVDVPSGSPQPTSCELRHLQRFANFLIMHIFAITTLLILPPLPVSLLSSATDCHADEREGTC